MEWFPVCSSVTFYTANVFVARTENWSAAPDFHLCLWMSSHCQCAAPDGFTNYTWSFVLTNVSSSQATFVCCWTSCVEDAEMNCTYFKRQLNKYNKTTFTLSCEIMCSYIYMSFTHWYNSVRKKSNLSKSPLGARAAHCGWGLNRSSASQCMLVISRNTQLVVFLNKGLSVIVNVNIIWIWRIIS